MVYGKQEDWERYDQIYTEANTYMEGELKKRDAGQPVNLDDLMWFTHDFGGFLVSLKKYNEGKRFLQVCLDLENNNYYATSSSLLLAFGDLRRIVKRLYII